LAKCGYDKPTFMIIRQKWKMVTKNWRSCLSRWSFLPPMAGHFAREWHWMTNN
jgi:hypothetical protein